MPGHAFGLDSCAANVKSGGRGFREWEGSRDVESGVRAKRVAWLVVVVLGFAFCYSMGFQAGVSEGTIRADARMRDVSASLREVMDRAGSQGGSTSAGRVAAVQAVGPDVVADGVGG